MRGYAFEYDPSASLAKNIVTSERHELADYHNKWGSIIPKFAPFYRKDFEVRHIQTGRLLLEGIDYYLGHRFAEAATANKMPVYGSIMILDQTLSGAISFVKYRTVGGPHTIPLAESLVYLSREDNPDPRNADWVDVMKFPRSVPAIDPPDSIVEAIDKDVIAKQLDRIGKKMQELAQAAQDAYEQVIADTSTITKKIHNYDVELHDSRVPHHDVTYTQLKAIKKDGVAADTAKAYGMTLAQLVAFIEDCDVRISDKEVLARLVGDTLEGRLRLDGSNFIIQNQGGATTIDLKTGDLRIIAANNAVLKAGTVGKDPVGLISGKNALTLHVNDPGDVTTPLIYNGFYVIHAGNIANYMPTLSGSGQSIFTTAGKGITLTGKGTTGIPLTGTVTLPVATLTKEGIFSLSTAIISNSEVSAATPSALRQIKLLIDKLVPNSRRVNGKALTGDITLTKADFGLGNVDNTTPEQAVVSDAFTAAVKNKSKVDHQHTPDDLIGLGKATATTRGLVRLSNTISNDAESVLTTAAVTDLERDLEDLENDLYETVPLSALGITKYGDSSYLPIPAIGSYPAAGANVEFYSAVGLMESDGRLVTLRNGADLYERGVYYTYSTLLPDGQFRKYTPTTFKYQPAYLSRDVSVVVVGKGTEDVFTAKMSDGRWHVILTRGTMDGNYHIGVPINTAPSGIPMHNLTTPFVHGRYIYFINSDIHTRGPFVKLYRVLVADVEDGLEVTPERVVLSGVDAYGTEIDNVEMFSFTDSLYSTDLARRPYVLRNDNGYWSGSFNVRHSGASYELAIRGNSLRLYLAGQMYYSNSSTSRRAYFGMSYTVNLDTMYCKMDNPELIPITVTETSMTSKGRLSNQIPYSSGNGTVSTIVAKGQAYGFRYDGSATTPFIYPIMKGDSSPNYYEHLHANTKVASAGSNRALTGARGSVAAEGLRELAFASDNVIVGTHRSGGYLMAEVDPDGSYLPDGSGFGPTSNRRTISASQHVDIARIASVYEDGAALRKAGFAFYGPGTQNSLSSGLVSSQPITYPSATHSVVDTYIRNDLASVYASGRILKSSTVLVALGDPKVPGDAVYIVQAALYYNLTGQNNNRIWYASYIVDCTLVGSEIRTVSFKERIISLSVSTTATSLTGGATRGGNYKVVRGSEIHLLINTGIHYGYVGSSRTSSIRAVKRNGVWSATHHSLLHTRMSGWHYHKDLGPFIARMDNTAESIYARCYSLDDYGTVTQDVPIHSTRVASGWVIYFSEEVPFYRDGELSSLPVWDIDLSKEYPNAHKNATFYIYILPGSDEYVVLPKGDVATGLIYIGYCTTGSTQIEDLFVESFLSISDLQELNDHEVDRAAHDGKLLVNKERFNAVYIKNLPTLSELTFPTFREVFDVWKRISHRDNTTNYPANAKEINSWTYDEAADTVVCTVNSVTFVGFVSDTEVGDYVFDTLAGSDDGDNDAVAIILAYKEQGGIQHTLTAVRARSIEQHMRISTKFDIWYNYHQPSKKLLASTPGYTANEGAFSGRHARMYAERQGNRYVVRTSEFKMASKPEEFPSSELTYELSVDLSDYPELDMFNGGVSFGYGCMSQNKSRFVNMSRPDEGVGSYYATGELVRLASETRTTATAFRQGLVKSGSAIPIPSGFTAAQCKVLVDYHSNTDTTTAKTEVRVSCNPSTLVTTVELHNGTGWSSTTGTARYHLVAIK